MGTPNNTLTDAFHDSVVSGLADLRRGQVSIESNLGDLNASVKKLWGAVNATQQAVIIHERDCQLRSRVEQLEKQVSADAESDRIANCSRKEWLEWIRPAVWVLLAVIAGLVIRHPEVVSTSFKP